MLLFKEISHEPLQRRFSELLGEIVSERERLRPVLESGCEMLRELAEEIRRSRIQSPGMSELAERISRTRTALDNWLEVDDALPREGYPGRAPATGAHAHLARALATARRGPAARAGSREAGRGLLRDWREARSAVL